MQHRDLGHKVLVVLDHGSRFAKMAANPFSVTLKESNVNRVVGACDKSLWTWCLEATLELHRVVFDLFSGEHDNSHARLMRLVLADCVGRVLQPRWGTEIVTQQEILNSLSSIGLPSTSDDTDGVTLSGITLAVEALSQLSDAQMNGDAVHPADKKEKTVTKERTNFSRMPKCWETPSTSSEVVDSERKVVENAGSIVIFTSFTEAERLTELEREVADVIRCRNKIIKSLQDSSFSCISHVKMYIINVLPKDHQCGDLSSFKEVRTITPELSSCIYSRPAGDDLISVIHSVAIDIYDLVSTTVSGIPMKEEAQQGQSAVAINYDVELLHSREVHIELERLGLVVGNTMKNDITGTLMVYAENSTYPTARLVWSTPMPKGRWNMFPRSRHVSRVTPSAVNSRPSVCLSSYLLQGRNVMLEITRVPRCEGILSNVGAKLIAHTLIAHGGHIYIHANDVGTHSVLDCPTIRDKSQLKKTAHGRVADFASLIKESSLHLVEPGKETEKLPVTSAASCYQPRRQLLRITRYWPLRSDQCYIYNIPKRFDALFNILRQPHLSTVDADKCKQVIHQLVALKDSRERIGEPSMSTQLLKDGSSRDEQLKVVYLEMARHLGNYMNHSEKHSEIFYLFLQATNLERAIKMSTADVSVVDRNRSKRQETSGSNFAVASASAISTAASEVRNLSRSNSPLPKKPRKSIYLWKPNETLNLYEYLMEKEERHHRAHWVDFVGRVKAGNRPAHLYPNLDLSASAKQD
ncbi:unnamed protein product [Cylicocyclus nassatus]|uniref:Protein asunder n=1 Tax=Cylicocyclus nassatus TaxID=53992 RepID=A0AA36H0W7_CYLNA|nr:unnamed protein product [Cylicocyclus nassatus]